MLFAAASSVHADLSKVDRLLQLNGYQLVTNSYAGGTFYFNGHYVNGNYVPGFVQANYTTAGWNGHPIPFVDNNGEAITSPWSA